MRNRKQHRKGKKISRKLANLDAISQDKQPNLCSNCLGRLTSTDFETGKCTQCQHPIWR